MNSPNVLSQKTGGAENGSFFPTSAAEIMARLNSFDVERYDQSRNYLSGSVSRLSPYFTHGALLLTEAFNNVVARASRQDAFRFVYELGWREYYQRVWLQRGEGIFTDIYIPQIGATGKHMAAPIAAAKTGISVLDSSIEELIATGYMHNHARMWVASLTCNVALRQWQEPAAFMYYHLLDGDLASNTLSWQWIAGTFSTKKYFANQDNINKFSGYDQHGTILDRSYDELMLQTDETANALAGDFLLSSLPPVKLPSSVFKGSVSNRSVSKGSVSNAAKVFSPCEQQQVLLYHPWSLNPRWCQDEGKFSQARRILVLEPSHFVRFPISQKRLDFILQLAENITGLEVFVGEANELPGIANAASIFSVAHPMTEHFPGEKEPRAGLFPEVTGSFISFSQFWRKCEKLYFS